MVDSAAHAERVEDRGALSDASDNSRRLRTIEHSRKKGASEQARPMSGLECWRGPSRAARSDAPPSADERISPGDRPKKKKPLL
jgi:hypothetical protein